MELQVIDAIRAAMKGQESNQIYQAVRQGQMYADFLIVLVSQTNSVILDDSRCRSLQITLLYAELRNVALSGDEEKMVIEWAGRLRDFAQELFSLQRATELIRDRYFDGEFILFNDAIEDLERQTKITRGILDSYDRVVVESNQPQLAIASDDFDKLVAQLASKRFSQIVALERRTTLADFGETEAADAITKLHILESE